MNRLPFFWIDAFTAQPFGGNPAAVCPLTTWPDDALLQRLALQHGLSETAYFVRTAEHRFDLRWFTPANEVDLCGHATLASAHVLFNEFGESADTITFDSRSGPLTVRRVESDRLELDFPSRPARPLTAAEVPPHLLAALGHPTATWIGHARAFVVVLENEAAVRAVQPDFAALVASVPGPVLITAPGDDCDFVSRFFAPLEAIPEDPVTGSAHCILTPYWAQQLGRTTLTARQVSPRGGQLWCVLDGDRVHIAGQAVTYLTGEIRL